MKFLMQTAAAAIMLLPFAAAADARVCVPPDAPLHRGDSGPSVANLQIFLSHEDGVYPEQSIIGIFGPATERAVGRWQVKYGILPAGSSAGSGLGTVGPRTLALMKKLWDCDGPVSVGWITTSISGGTVLFSAQASSTYPLDPSLIYIDFGDGEHAPVTVSNTVCATAGEQCSSIISAVHTYAAGKFTASIKKTVPITHCTGFSPAWICAQAASSRLLGVVTISSNGVASVPPALTAPITSGAAPASSYSVSLLGVPSQRVPPSVSGSISLSGGAVSVKWVSTSTPPRSSAEIMLYDADGNAVGTIVHGLYTSGSYWWNIPYHAGDICTSHAITCLAQIASLSCGQSICSLDNGTYAIVVRIRGENGDVIAASRVGMFSLNNASFTVLSTASPTTTGIADDGLMANIGAYGAYGAYGARPAPTSSVLPRSCTYSGVQYGDGITLTVNCADVASNSCNGFGSQVLTCNNGSWVNASGTPVSIQNVTTPARIASSSCRTPWGGEIVQDGNQITYEPFFTGGTYSGSIVIPLMQCTNGRWEKCDWQGAHCAAYTKN